MPRSASAIQAELDGWYAARAALQDGQTVTFAGKTLSQVDLTKINDTITMLERELAGVNAAGSGRAAWARRATLGGMGY